VYVPFPTSSYRLRSVGELKRHRTKLTPPWSLLLPGTVQRISRPFAGASVAVA
jgi:hypothetical protein